MKHPNKTNLLAMVSEFKLSMIRLLLYNPEGIRAFIAAADDKKYALGFLYRLTNYRTGLEIDVAGGDIDLAIKFSQHEQNNKSFVFGYGGNMSHAQQNENMCVELQFSVFKVQGYKYLKQFLDHCNTSSTMCPALGGGLHIHVDLGTYWHRIRDRSSGLTEFIRHRIIKQLPFLCKEVFKVKISRKPLEAVCFGSSSAVSIYRHLDTIEYRLGKPTFDYTTVMRQILICSLLNYSIRLRRQFDLQLARAILQA